jgi:hypothetical protein
MIDYHRVKFPEGQLSYFLWKDETISIKMAGYIGINNILENFQELLPITPELKTLFLTTLKDTANRIALLLIHGGLVSSTGKIILAHDPLGSSHSKIRHQESVEKILCGTAENLGYYPGVGNKSPTFITYGAKLPLHSKLSKSFERSLDNMPYFGEYRFHHVDLAAQTLMFISRIHGHGPLIANKKTY